MLIDTIKAQIKAAMIAKDSVRLETLRGLSAAFTNDLVAKGHKPQDVISDEDALAVITRTAKQRKDAIAQFRAAGRMDLVAEDEAQLAVLEEFLPTLMSKEEISVIVETKKATFATVDQKEKGKLMAELMKDLKGKADGALVKEVVDALFV